MERLTSCNTSSPQRSTAQRARSTSKQPFARHRHRHPGLPPCGRRAPPRVGRSPRRWWLRPCVRVDAGRRPAGCRADGRTPRRLAARCRPAVPRGETPGTRRESRLPMIVAIAPDDVGGATSIPVKSKLPVAEARMPWARHSKVGAAPAVETRQHRQADPPSSVRAVMSGQARKPEPEAKVLRPRRRRPRAPPVSPTPSAPFGVPPNRAPPRASS